MPSVLLLAVTIDRANLAIEEASKSRASSVAFPNLVKRSLVRNQQGSTEDMLELDFRTVMGDPITGARLINCRTHHDTLAPSLLLVVDSFPSYGSLSILALSEKTDSIGIEPEELAIASLRTSLFDLLDTRSAFLTRLHELSTIAKVTGAIRALSPLEPARQEARWLVAFVKKCVELESIFLYTTPERRRSVSVMIDMCIFQLTYLSKRLWIQEDSLLSTRRAMLTQFGGTKDIEPHLSTLSAYRLHTRSHGPWIMIYDNVDLDVNLSWLTKEVPGYSFAHPIEALESCHKPMGRGNLVLASTDFNTRPGNYSQPRRTKSLPVLELSSLEKQDAMQLFWALLGNDETASTTEGVEKLVDYANCKPRALREITSYMAAMRLSISQYLKDTARISRMKTELLIEEFQDACNSNGMIIRSADSVDPRSKAATPADILTTASFVAKILLSIPRLRMMFGMIERSVHHGSQLEEVLETCGLRLESIAKEDLHKKYAAFIQKHPKRIAFTIRKQSLQAQEGEKESCASDRQFLTRSSMKESSRELIMRRFSLPLKGNCPLRMKNRLRYSGDNSPIEEVSDNDAGIRDLMAIRLFFEDQPTIDSLIATACIQHKIPLDIGQLLYMLGLCTSACKPAMVDDGQEISVSYNMKWELPTLVNKVFKKNQSIQEIVVINGKAIDAQLTTCAEYVAQHWKLAKSVLDALDASNKGVHEFGNIHISETRELAGWQNHTNISVRGDLNVQADIASTLAWLTASIRYSETKEISESRSSITLKEVGGKRFFEIESLPLERVTKDKSCWHQLFVYMVVAPDYPVAARKQGVGLEINHERMTSLARASLIAERDHGFIIRGLQFMLVPTKLLDHGDDDCEGLQAVQWHIHPIAYEKENSSTKADSSAEPTTPRCMKCRSRKEFTQLISRRIFLGF